MPRDQVYKEILRVAVGKQSFRDIVAELEKLSKLKPQF